MKKLKYAEKEMLKMSTLTGGFTYAMLTNKENGFGFNPRRLNDLCKNDILEKHEFNEKVDGKMVRRYTYSPAQEGAKFLKSEGYEYIQGHTGIGHLEKAEKFIWEEIKENGTKIENILNEPHQRHWFISEIQEAEKNGVNFAVNDFVILNGETQEIERVVEIENNYGKELINQHRAYAEKVLNHKYEYIK
jgi:hypothetical protein